MRDAVLPRLAGAVALLAVYFALGFLVRGAPGALDNSEPAFAGHALGIAAFFTRAGLFPVYLALSVATLIFGFVRRDLLRACATIVVTLILAWKSSDLLKELFHRARPSQWYVFHESSFSYSSGHATLSLAFYGLWAYVAWRTLPPSPLRTFIVAALAIWIAAIGWSRLALGAHFPTDVLGGYLLGAVWLLLGMIAVDASMRVRAGATAT